jgi:hypothetical protein
MLRRLPGFRPTTAALLAAALVAAPRPALAEPPPGAAASSTAAAAQRYPWPRRRAAYEPLAQRIAPPPGFARVPAAPGSYAHWLRHLPLLPAEAPVRSFRGELILPAGHRALAAVVDLDLSPRDLQQCADSAMRLRGEYLRASGRARATSFLWSGRRRFSFDEWARGVRPVRDGRRWRFALRAPPAGGAGAFRSYLELIFSWTGTWQLAGERSVPASAIAAGDFFVQAGSPGHAVVVIDLARDRAGWLRALIGQGYMPAQDLHLLRSADGSAWFALDPPQPLRTPIWPRAFGWNELRRFAD